MDTFPAGAVERAPALIRDQVAAQIRDAIAEQRLAPGQLLVERELCETTTASRATVREALRQLESEGLVSSTNGRGTVVTVLSTEDARHIYEVRSALEGLAGRLFAERASAEDRASLLGAMAELERVAGDTRAMLKAKTAFYDVLTQGARNGELTRSLQALTRRVTLVRAMSLSREGRWKESLAEVRAICSAAVAGDANEAERLCREHIRQAAKTLTEPDS
ncbi:GntR family transcriptional regulator [Streptomyces carpinensis]|uniref:GntR family transcriptional regulator n=1 Tax=Streptomyces carpinensis TaxID=66369 RepID=A0ABV1VYF9_9ACTN|nr:GntR family transcriptional regulator [Streptomyces carpinensis]